MNISDFHSVGVYESSESVYFIWPIISILQEYREFSLATQYRTEPCMVLVYPDGEVLWIPPVDIKVKTKVDILNNFFPLRPSVLTSLIPLVQW